MKHVEQRVDTLRMLRVRAERTLQDVSPAPVDGQQDDRILREIRLHELELSMQNEELHQLCEEVHGLNERYVDLFMGAPIAYFVLDSQARIINANLAAAKVLGVEHALLHDLKLSSFVETEHTENFVRHMRAVLHDQAAHKVELPLRLPDETTRDVRLESSRDPRRPQEWRVAVIDLTDVRRLERELERSRGLEAMGTFAASVAHDFGNLLSLIGMGVDLAVEIGAQHEDAKSPLQRVQRAVREGRRMVRQMLRFSSDHENDAQAFALDAAVSGVAPELHRLSGQHVQLQISLGAPAVCVKLELGAPEEIVLNLAANALQAMPSGGILCIDTFTSAEPAELNGTDQGKRYAVLRVRDTGRGMDAETCGRAFEPFFTTRRGAGTGLGLSMVQRIVTRAGGQVRVESELGKGTTLLIYLPVCEDEVSANRKPPQP